MLWQHYFLEKLFPSLWFETTFIYSLFYLGLKYISYIFDEILREMLLLVLKSQLLWEFLAGSGVMTCLHIEFLNYCYLRRSSRISGGARISNDQFPKQWNSLQGGPVAINMLNPGNFFGFQLSKVSFPWPISTKWWKAVWSTPVNMLHLFNNHCHTFTFQRTEDLTMKGVVSVIREVFGAGGEP